MDFHIVELPSSKSISNRLLIIHALGHLEQSIENLSPSDDTMHLQNAIRNNASEMNVGEGGTTLRFILSYFCLTGQLKFIDGQGNLRSRPLLPLIRVLEQLGCLFEFQNKEYHLPIKILKGVDKEQSDEIYIDSSVSSQFVSSILMIAPYFQTGLKVKWSSESVSEPYIHMTLQLMHHYGIQFSLNGNSVHIKPGTYRERKFKVEADWSAAAFILCWMALQEKSICFFPHLRRSGLQADEAVIDFLQPFGLTPIEKDNGLIIEKKSVEYPNYIQFDFTHCPDLFPALALFCALQKVNATFKGLQHLVHKESNRLQIITNFLREAQVDIHVIRSGHEMYFGMQSFRLSENIQLDSHQDHRIAMAFSLLNKLTNVSIAHPDVVSKSFPGYWKVFEELRMYSG